MMLNGADGSTGAGTTVLPGRREPGVERRARRAVAEADDARRDAAEHGRELRPDGRVDEQVRRAAVGDHPGELLRRRRRRERRDRGAEADGGDEGRGIVDRRQSADRDHAARGHAVALQAGGDAVDPRVEGGPGDAAGRVDDGDPVGGGAGVERDQVGDAADRGGDHLGDRCVDRRVRRRCARRIGLRCHRRPPSRRFVPVAGRRAGMDESLAGCNHPGCRRRRQALAKGGDKTLSYMPQMRLSCGHDAPARPVPRPHPPWHPRNDPGGGWRGATFATFGRLLRADVVHTGRAGSGRAPGALDRRGRSRPVTPPPRPVARRR